MRRVIFGYSIRQFSPCEAPLIELKPQVFGATGGVELSKSTQQKYYRTESLPEPHVDLD